MQTNALALARDRADLAAFQTALRTGASIAPKSSARVALWAQANPSDYSYVAFSKKVKAAGCAGYLVSFPGRRVVYFGPHRRN